MPSNTSTAPIDLDHADLAWSALNQAKRIGIISHRHPDPDTIGSNLAMRTFLLGLGKEIHSFCVDQIPYTCQFLPESKTYRCELQPLDYDLLISVDCGSTSQVAYGQTFPELFHRNFLNIDHHTSNDLFGTINIVQTNLSSTCEIVFNLFRYWNVKITPSIATYLLFGLYYDTGSFMHSNVTPAVLEMADHLMQYGANQKMIISNLYCNFSEEKFHLWGKTLEGIKITEKNSAASVIPREEIINHKNVSETLSGVIDYVSMTKGTDYAVMISEEKPGHIKGSLRTRYDDINLSDLAGKMGGGGHRKASGFGFPGKLSKETSWKIVTPSS